MKKLQEIQCELKAPKQKKNEFGKYLYRSCEDILEAVKPLLIKYDCCLTLTDEVVLLGERFYVKATATIVSNEDNTSKEVVAFAREEDSKKGMDGAQVTGSASSYARKYALNGLFLIDDNKDIDEGKKVNMSSLLTSISLCRTVEELTAIWKAEGAPRTNETFKNAVAAKGQELDKK